MRRIESYRWECMVSLGYFEENANNRLGEGYEPVGSIAVLWNPDNEDFEYCQAFAKYSDGARQAEDYRVIFSTSTDIEDSVQNKLDEGYELVGGAAAVRDPSLEATTFFQAVVKYRDSDSDEDSDEELETAIRMLRSVVDELESRRQ